jgi:putative ABC transport system permease protein
MIKSFRLLNLRRLRKQPLRAVIAIIAVAAGVSLALAVVILQSSITYSFEQFGQRVAGPTPLRVIGATNRGGLDPTVVPKIQETPGVEAVVPVVQAVTLVQPAHGRAVSIVVFGIDCSMEALVGRFGCDPSAMQATDAPPVISRRLATDLGDGGVIRTDAGRIPAPPAAQGLAQLDNANQGKLALFTLPTAERLFARNGRIDVAYVKPKPGTSLPALQKRLEQAVGPWNGVLTTKDPPPDVASVLTTVLPLFSIISFLALGIGALLVYNTLTLSLEERRRQLAIAAAIGAPGRTVMVGTLAEAGVLGLLGGLVGVAGGSVVAGPIVNSIGSFVGKASGVPVNVHTSNGTIVIGAILGVLVSVLAAIMPVRRALKADVAAELANRQLREEAAPSWSAVRGTVLVLIAGAGVLVCWLLQRHGALDAWQATAAPLAFVVSLLAMMFAMGTFVPGVIRSGLHLLPKRRAVGRLGFANLIREPRRTGVMGVAIGAAVGVAFMTASFNKSVHDGISSGNASARYVRVATIDANNTFNLDAKLSPPVVQRLGTLPGVQRVDREVFLLTGHRQGDLIAVSGADYRRVNDSHLIQGRPDEAAFERGGAMIGPGLARRNHLRAGDTVKLPTPTGFVDVPVIGVWQDGNFGGQAVTMTVAAIEKIYGPLPTEGASLRPQKGVSPNQLAAEARAANLDPDVQIQTPTELVKQVTDDTSKQLAPFWALQRALLLVSFIAVLSTLLLVGVQRRRELGLLAAIGMQPKELSAMVFTEAGAVGVAGTMVGTLLSVISLTGLIVMIPILIGYRDPFRMDFTSVAVYGTVGIVVVLLAAAWPAWRTSRLEVLEALQYE